MSLLDHLPHTMNVQRMEYAEGEFIGEQPAPQAAYATAVPCWVQPANRNDVTEYGRREMVVTHKIYHVQAVALAIDDLVTPQDGPYAGRVLTVKWFGETTVGLDHCQKIMCEERRR